MVVTESTLLLEVQDLCVGYEAFAIEHITCTIPAGTIFGLLGRSGSGKSTLIKALVGLEKPKGGTISLRSGDATFTLAHEVGYSPQANALYPHLTIEENILTFADLYGVSLPSARQRMDALLERLDLVSGRHKRVEQLSGGMEKRVDLAVSLIHDPRVIVLDEPFNGLDVSLQQFIWGLLQELASRGKIIIITSHLLDDVQKNCKQFGLIENMQFYGDDHVRSALTSRQKSLQAFLEELFRDDLLREGKKS